MTTIAILLAIALASVSLGIPRARSVAVVRTYRGPTLAHAPAGWTSSRAGGAPGSEDAFDRRACSLGIC